MIITHEQISQRAREIWEREGRPEGKDKEHWLQAETELRQNGLSQQNGASLNSEDSSMLQVPADLQKEEGSRKRGSRRVK